MEMNLKQVLKKNWIAFATMAITIGILVYFLITTDGIPAFLKILPRMRWQWIGAMFLAIFAYWASEGVAIYYISRRIYPNWPLWNSFIIGMVGLLYGALTPFSTGGQPMQVYYMNKMGMDTAKAAAIITVKTMVYQITMLVFALVMVFWKLSYFQEKVSDFAFVTLIGVVTNLIFIGAVFFFAFNRKLTNRIVKGVVHLLYKTHICKDEEKWANKVLGGFNMYYDSTHLIGKNIKMYAVVMAFQCVQIFCYSIVTYFIYLSFNFHDHHADTLITMLAAQSFVTMVSAFVPLPGASGGAEGSFALYFQTFFIHDTLVPAIFIWRIVTYYLSIAVGCVFAMLGKRVPWRAYKLNPALEARVAAFDKARKEEDANAKQLEEQNEKQNKK